MLQLQNYYQNYMHQYSRSTAPNPEEFSLTDLTLIDLSKHLYEISLINQHYQEIEFNSNFLNQMSSTHKEKICEELLSVHKKISHFILKNKDLDASV